MSGGLRVLLSLALLLLCWPELRRYQAERELAQAQKALEEVLGNRLPEDQAVLAVTRAATLALAARDVLPGDLRPPHSAAIALLMLRRLPEASAVLESAIAHGDRPELSVNLGRVRASQGDMAGAERAWLHSAWAQPRALDTLPAAQREPILARLAALETALREGRHEGLPPPL